MALMGDWTPLMHAVMNDAPDDVLEDMIETATPDYLEQQTSVGATILHFLAVNARVSAMRRVLEKTNENINTQDMFGRTPLHCCLEEKLTHEQHKEVAILNITFGASLTIKDMDGKTPLDVYDDNECEYEETTKTKKKEELKELLKELSIPSEILARGPEAVKAFKDALKTGEITVVNSRMMFLGKEGSGKTSCVKAMLGKAFDKEERSTDGIVTTTVFQTDGDYSKWEEQNDVDVCEQTKEILEYGIAADVAKKLKQPNSEQNKSKFVSDVERPSSSSSVASTSAELQFQLPEAVRPLPPTLQKKSRVKTVGLSHDKMGVSTNHLMKYEIRKKIVENFANKSSGPRDITCIWDYAGQMIYYITHRFFLTDRSSYGVVFSLVDDLNDFVKPRKLNEGKFDITNMQMIIFWIRSIYEHAVLLHGTEKEPVKGIASPPISLIGTHKDLLMD
ncbi:uncharacterized protein LOC117110638 [Anneissia japonica]|uniref:uncharacterized protein LOC117110638 n=1 Tax=Anneissia japonica TaxID=1529436 RepID=UPI0014258AD0|nr:uncharacterized protein LOC117110638 [Anneissia japonica]